MVSYGYHDSRTSAIMNDFFDRFGQYIEEITVDDGACQTVPEISLTFSRWAPGSADEQVVGDAQQRWDGIQKLISQGAIDRLRALNSVQKFMDSRNLKTAVNSVYGLPAGYTDYMTMRDALYRDLRSYSKRDRKENEMAPRVSIMNIEKVVFNGPATIIFWKDKTKTVVKCMEGDVYDPEKAVLLACLEHSMGGKGPAKKWLKKMTEGALKNSPNIVDSEDAPIGMSREKEQAEFEKIKFQCRQKKFKKFVDKRTAMTGMNTLEFLDCMNCFIHYTHKTALDWYDGVKPISDTAWKQICKAYPSIMEDTNA